MAPDHPILKRIAVNVVFAAVLVPGAIFAWQRDRGELAFFLVLAAAISLLPVVLQLWVVRSDRLAVHWAFLRLESRARTSFRIACGFMLFSLIFTKISIWPILMDNETEAVYSIQTDLHHWKPLYIVDIMNTGHTLQQELRVYCSLEAVPLPVTAVNGYFKRYKTRTVHFKPTVSLSCRPTGRADYLYFSDHTPISIKGKKGACGKNLEFIVYNLEPEVKLRLVLTFAQTREKSVHKTLNQIRTLFRMDGKIYRSHPEFTHFAKTVRAVIDPF